MKYLLLQPVFAAAGIALFVAFVAAVIWLAEAEAWLSDFWDGFGGLVVQLGLWLVGISIVLFAFLRLVGFLAKARDGKGPA